MKIIKTIIICIILSLSFSTGLVYASLEGELNEFGEDLEDLTNGVIQFGNGTSENDLNLQDGSSSDNNDITKNKLELLDDGEFLGVTTVGEKGINNMLYNIAKSLKNLFFIIAGLYFLILVLRLVVADNSEEEVEKFKKGLIWISIGLIVTQVAYSFVGILYNEDISQGLANDFIDGIIFPIIELLQAGAAFFFIAISIYAFFRSVSANGDEEKVKRSRMSILYSLIGLVVIKIANLMVDTIYGEIKCEEMGYAGMFGEKCYLEEDLEGAVEIMANIINWVNGFVGIILIVLIIYTGFQLIFSMGNEEAVSKAKKSIIYIVAGFGLLFVNYLILTFFIIPESSII